jgi:putative transposase
MHRPRPGRLAGFSYRGIHRYSLTLCTANRRRCFVSENVVNPILLLLREHVKHAGFALIGYCFMPDHLHLLVSGLSGESDLRAFVFAFKQAAGYWYRRTFGIGLWQDGYYDRVLRPEDDTKVRCRYILGNPARDELATSIGLYLFAGSDVYRIEEIVDQLAW